MIPTPMQRPYSISVEKRVYWSLKVISKGLIGDGQHRAELTPDGIAATLLAEAIEAKWPGLIDGYRKREQVDAEYVERVTATLKSVTEKK